MNLHFYEEELDALKEFAQFKKENMDAFLCSVFISIDKETGKNEVHFDYFIPKTKGMVSFQINSEVKKVLLENFNDKMPEEISLDFDLDFDWIEAVISKKMEEENIKNKIQKFLFSLQSLKGENFLNGTVFISSLGMLKIMINVDSKEIMEFEKKSLFDIMKVVKK
jgi:hypothetical protein